MQALAHNRATDRMTGAEYWVWEDSSETAPLAPEAAEALEQAKRFSASMPNFRGSVVKLSKATVALRHSPRANRRGSV